MEREHIDELEKVTGKLVGLHKEISLLAKKSSTDGLNTFKLKLLNNALALANKLLGTDSQPVEGFTQFDPDDVPSNSDATVVLAMYLEEIERYRSNLLTMKGGMYWYMFSDGEKLKAAPPKRLGKN